MNREPIPGECVIVTGNSGCHPAKAGDRFIVEDVDDDDSTLRGIPVGSSAVADFWIPWGDVKPVTLGWSYARRHLPPDVVRLLSACERIDCIGLNWHVKLAIVDSLPDWRDRVMAAAQRVEESDDDIR